MPVAAANNNSKKAPAARWVLFLHNGRPSNFNRLFDTNFRHRKSGLIFSILPNSHLIVMPRGVLYNECGAGGIADHGRRAGHIRPIQRGTKILYQGRNHAAGKNHRTIVPAR